MKVLFVNCSDKGSTGRIIDLISNELSASGDESIICYEIGEASNPAENRYKISRWFEPGIFRRIKKITSIPYGFAPFSTKRLIKIILHEKPEVVHIHCPNSHTINVYKLLKFLKGNRINTVITNHCEMFYTGNCAHSYECNNWETGCKKCPYFRRYVGEMLFDRTSIAFNEMKMAMDGFEKNSFFITSVSNWVYQRSLKSPITGGYNNILIENALDTTIFNRKKFDENIFKNKYNIAKNKTIFLFVSASLDYSKHSPKGAYFLNEVAKKMDNDNAIFLTIGPIKNLCMDLSKNIINVGQISDLNELSKFYNIADAALVLSKRETFSMVCAEALSCGTPVVGFKAGGPESISIPEFSFFYNYGDVDSLVKKLVDICNSNLITDKNTISKKATEKFSENSMCSKYVSLYKQFFND